MRIYWNTFGLVASKTCAMCWLFLDVIGMKFPTINLLNSHDVMTLEKIMYGHFDFFISSKVINVSLGTSCQSHLF
jgi:hypothetical protein